MTSSQLVLLRGLAREAAHWGDFPKVLAAQLQNSGDRVEVLTPDLPGFGEGRMQKPGWTIEEITRAVHSRLPAAPSGSRGVIAMSLGGMVGLEWVRLHPAEIDWLVLINTSVGRFARARERLTPEALTRLLGIVFATSAEVQERRVLDLVSNSRLQQARALPIWTQLAEASGRPIQAAFRQLVAASRFEAPENRPTVPTLIVRSLGDRMVSPRCSARMAEAWRLEMITHPTAGHDLALDDPDWLAREIGNWARQLNAKRNEVRGETART